MTSSAAWEQLAGPLGGEVTSLCLERDGSVLASIDGSSGCRGKAGLFRSTDRGRSFALVAPLADHEPVRAVTSGPDALHAASQRGLRRSTDGGRSWSSLEVGLDCSNVVALAPAPDGRQVVATYGGGAYLLEEGGRLSRVLREPAFLSALASGGGLLLAGGESKLLRSRDGIAWAQLRPAGAPRSGPSALTVDSTGRALAVAFPGELQLSHDAGASFQSSPGAPDSIRCLLWLPGGALLAGASRGLYLLPPGAGSFRELPSGHASITALLLLPDGTALAGTSAGGILHVAGEAALQVRHGFFPILELEAVVAGAEGLVLARSRDAAHLSRDEGESWEWVAAAGAICSGPSGELWIAGEGISRSVDGVTWRHVGAAAGRAPASGEPRDSLRQTSLWAGAGNELWAGFHLTWLSFYPTGDDPMPILQSAAMERDEVHRSLDGGATWERLDGALCASGFAADRTGAVLLAGPSGLFRLEAAGPRRLLERPATCVEVDRDGRILVGTPAAAWLSSDDGASFAALGTRTTEAGPWGSLEQDAVDFERLSRAPDGSLWAATGRSSGGGVFVLGRGATRWRSVNLGLCVIPGVGSRPGSLGIRAVAVAQGGTAFAATSSHGLFRLKGFVC